MFGREKTGSMTGRTGCCGGLACWDAHGDSLGGRDGRHTVWSPPSCGPPCDGLIAVQCRGSTLFESVEFFWKLAKRPTDHFSHGDFCQGQPLEHFLLQHRSAEPSDTRPAHVQACLDEREGSQFGGPLPLPPKKPGPHRPPSPEDHLTS